MANQKQVKQFAKFLAYILERHPEEFGLIPDAAGFVKIKELLKAVCETEGWRHIRRSHIDELLLVLPDPQVEIDGNYIRAKSRDRLPVLTASSAPPKLLYTCVREKAYPHVAERGIAPTGHSHVICNADPDAARKLGRRKDNHPVMLTIHTHKTADHGISFYQYGDGLYLAEFIPVDTFTGPPVPQKPEKEKQKPSEKSKKSSPRAAGGGAYAVTPDMLESGGGKKPKTKKKPLTWKQEQRRRKKEKGWPDQ